MTALRCLIGWAGWYDGLNMRDEGEPLSDDLAPLMAVDCAMQIVDESLEVFGTPMGSGELFVAVLP